MKTRKTLVVVAAALFAVLAVACDPKVAGGGPVCVWGDSITQQAFSDLVKVTNERDQAHVVATGGVDPGWGFHNWDYYEPRIANVRAGMKDGNCVGHIIAFGTNDEGDELSVYEYAAEIDRFIDATGAVPTLLVAPNRFARKSPVGKANINQAIDSEVGRRPYVRVLHYDAYMTEASMYDPGGVHLTASGTDAWSSLIENELRCFWPLPAGALTVDGESRIDCSTRDNGA